MYVFAATPERSDFLSLAQYLSAPGAAERVAPQLAPLRAQVATELRRSAAAPTIGAADRRRYHALRLFVR
jgi:hypothetical protein